MSSFADTIEMRSGERLNGRVIHKSGDTLKFQTDYAGELRIQWSKVVSIATDAPVTVQIDGLDAPIKAKLDAESPERVALKRKDGPEHAEMNPEIISLTQLIHINPLPEETRNGVNYKGRANLSFSKAQGNTQNEAVYGETAFAARARQFRYELNAKANRSEDANMLTNSNWLVGGNYDRFLDPRHFIYGRASVEHDRFKGIEQRDVVGAGYGLQLIDRPQTQLSVRGGLDYVTLRQTSESDEEYPSLGWGVKYSHKLDSYRAELFHEQEGFWNLTNINEITLRTRSGLRVPLMAGITATSQLNVDWERSPAPGRRATDSLFLFGLGYEW